MAMDAATIERLIREGLPDAQVTIEDLRGDGDHYAAHRRLRRVQGQEPRTAASAGLSGAQRAHGQRAPCPGVADQPPGRLSRDREEHDMTITNATVIDRIKQDIADHPVVLFMKGTPVFPQCGFSAAVVQILTHLGVKFKGIDVLADPEIRQGHQGILELADHPAALRQGRVRRRLRHRPRDVRGGRARRRVQRQGHRDPRLKGIETRG